MAGSSSRIPLSMLLRDKEAEDEEPKKKSREDWRKAKELEEARKAGTAPAAVDEEGRDINPHIPQYISSVPWYYNTTGPTLKHQRPQDDRKEHFSGIDEWYKRGVDSTKVVTKFRKGACENCGAMTHKRVDCMERPRKVGAKFSAKQIAHDEFIQPKIVSDYDGKRDRWAGYDPANHREIVEEYLKIEQAKRELRAQKLKEKPDLAEDEGESDEDKYVDEVDMPGTKVDSKQRITVRNLRIREDTAKYLRNLDPNSAYYDPKTRSMRDNPNPNLKPEETDFAGENFVRFSGDIQKHAQAQLFAWEAYGKGVDVHVLAEPTKLELLQKEYDKKKSQFKDEVKNKVLEQYGGEEHLAVPPKALLLAQTENYVEYSRQGKIIKGQDKPIIRSRYEEDVYINNHTTVWGSFWGNGVWGYRCCESTIKNSYCVGENGKDSTTSNSVDTEVHTETGRHEAAETEGDVVESTANERNVESKGPSAATDEKNLKQLASAKEANVSGGVEGANSGSSSSSESDQEADGQMSKKSKKSKKKRKKEKRRQQREERKEQKRQDKEKTKLELALEAEERNQKRGAELLRQDERKRPYNSMYEARVPTEEEIEAYMMKRRREEDPMAAFLDK
ncbi:pre-mRNA-splicing factor Slu7 isoform X1 [Anopheles bellator]|uniref:pre-mRNA-splicing factor Slu7 isoform X1 n=1 Tax=Anopheles bellator TaxID=139047 RepID=UPI002647ADE9|nr:pre-mRNA-splicing factor Slu7 isoform X1 [Anopheles bellator]